MTKSNLTKKDFPADTFRFYNDKNLDKNGVEAGENSEKSAMKNQDRNKKKALEMLKRNTESLNESEDVFKRKPERKEIFKDEDIFEIPATPPKDKKRASNNNQSLPTDIKTPITILKNKALQKSLNVSMLSSPSIMSSSTKLKRRTEPVAAGSPNAKNQKPRSALNVDDIFDEMKKYENTNKNDIKCHESSGSTVDQSVCEIPVCVKTPEKNSIDEKKNDKLSKPDSPGLSPVKEFETRNWAEIDADLLRHLKENSTNFHLILNELKKANEKILDFRRALANSEFK